MEYTKLGRTGLDVARICLGCMSYGGGNRGNHAWRLGEEESRPFIKKALEAGINFSISPIATRSATARKSSVVRSMISHAATRS
jgi:predicted aldo/keto reductase-like oxidoreductase